MSCRLRPHIPTNTFSPTTGSSPADLAQSCARTGNSPPDRESRYRPGPAALGPGGVARGRRTPGRNDSGDRPYQQQGQS
jgi:hypothetical protein